MKNTPSNKEKTILQLLRRVIEEDSVPTLCDAPNLKPFGSCRVCSVDVSLTQGGAARAQASCHTPVVAGSYIYPHSDRIKRLRKNIVELVLTDYPKEHFNEANPTQNELKKVALQCGINMDQVRYAPGDNHVDRRPDEDHAYMESQPFIVY